MSKIAVVYWSGTGNTKAMADAVAEGVNASGGEATLLTAAEFDPALLDSFGAVAFGYPSMGSEELEESEFAPMFEGCVAPTAGGTGSGCAPGRRTAEGPARCWPASR